MFLLQSVGGRGKEKVNSKSKGKGHGKRHSAN